MHQILDGDKSTFRNTIIIMKETILGIIGTTFSFGGIYISLQQVELYLRIISLVIGIIVGITTWIMLLKGKKLK